MSEFDDKLKQAAARGANRANQSQSEAERKRIETEEFRSLHSKSRLELSDRIETVLKRRCRTRLRVLLIRLDLQHFRPMNPPSSGSNLRFPLFS